MQELALLDDDANVYKLIGPALIKQDLVEAKSNVQKRLDYIKGELDRLDAQIKSTENKVAEKQAEVSVRKILQVDDLQAWQMRRGWE